MAIRGVIRLPKFDLKKIEKVVEERGLRVLKQAGSEYLRVSAKLVAVKSGHAVAALTPLSRILDSNIISSAISGRQKVASYKFNGSPRSAALGAGQSGMTFDLAGLTFAFQATSGIVHFPIAVQLKSGLDASGFKEEGIAAFASMFMRKRKFVFPHKSDKVVKITRRSIHRG